MADCGTELRTALAPASDGQPGDNDVLILITGSGYFALSMSQLWQILDGLYAVKDHNHNLANLADIDGEPEDGQLLAYDAEEGKFVWFTPDWMPSGGNFDDRYVLLNPVNKSFTTNSSYALPAGRILEKVVVIPTANLTAFSVGTAPGSEDIMPGIPIAADGAQLFELNIYTSDGMSVWFNGITAETTVKIYLR